MGVPAKPSPGDVLLALRRASAGLDAACQAQDSEYVRTTALNVLASLEPLRDQPQIPLKEWRVDVPKNAYGALWLVDRSAEHLLEQLDSERPDWGLMGAQASFLGSGVDQLERELDSAVRKPDLTPE